MAVLATVMFFSIALPFVCKAHLAILEIHSAMD
jgi:hypothetical protein